MLTNAGQYNKFIVVILGTIATSLQQYYGNTQWVSLVISISTALTVYLVPNVNKSNVTPNETTGNQSNVKVIS